MKALIIKGSIGEYDSYQEFVTNIFLVPDDFNADEEYKKFVELANLPKRKDGQIMVRYVKEIPKRYVKHLQGKYKELEFIDYQ